MHCADEHIARVSASGPNWSLFGAEDFHVPIPRLQSTRALTRPFLSKVTVYFVLSSGVSVFPSPPSNFTSCQDVPPRSAAALLGRGRCGRTAGNSKRKRTKMTLPIDSSRFASFNSTISRGDYSQVSGFHL